MSMVYSVSTVVHGTRTILRSDRTRLVVLLGLVILGIVTGLHALHVGHHVAFGLTRLAPWGIGIAAYAFLAIIATGACVLAAFNHGSRGMTYISIAAILGAFFTIGLELESPWRMPLGIILHANVMSNIWWMGALYGAALGVMMLEILLLFRGNTKAAYGLGITAAIVEVLANSNLGSVFASLSAKPLWYGAQLPVFFIASSVLSGAAAVALFTNEQSENLRKLMMLMIGLISVSTLWKVINQLLGGEMGAYCVCLLTKGPLAISFWGLEIALGLAIPMVLLILGYHKIPGLLILIGQFASRYNLVVAGQAVPNVPLYIPTVPEVLIVIGGIALALLALDVLNKRRNNGE